MTRPYLDYGLSDFINRRSNILFVTGYMGSGKSTIAKQIATENSATALGLDYVFEWNSTANVLSSDIEQNAFFHLLEKGKLWTRINGNIGTYSNKWLTMSASQRAIAIIDLAIANCDSEHRYIIEGIHLYVYPEIFNKIIDCPIIIMNLNIRQAQHSDFQRSRDRGAKLFNLILNRGDKRKYYVSQEKLFMTFIAKVKAAKEGIEMQSASLEAMMIPGIDLGIGPGGIFFTESPDDIAYEGFFVPNNATPETMEWGVVKGYGMKTKNGSTGFYFIDDKYIQNMLQNWQMCPGEFPSKGTKLLESMVVEVRKMKEFAEKHQEEMSSLHDAGNVDAANDLYQQQAKLAPTVQACGNLLTQNKDVFAGSPTTVTAQTKAKVSAVLKELGEIMSVAAHNAETAWVNFNNASTVSKLFKGNKMRLDARGHGALWANCHFYCRFVIATFESAVIS